MSERVLETERLILRPLGPADFEDLCRLDGDPEVMRFLGQGQPRPRAQTWERLGRLTEHWRRHGIGIWALRHRQDGAFVGSCGVAPLHSLGEMELGYTLARPSWGQGLATEAAARALRYAFEVAQLPRVLAVALRGNVASQKVLARVGLRFLSDYVCEGQDAVLYAIANPSTPPVREQ